MDYDYLFGLIDTDGSIYIEKGHKIRKTKARVRLKITLTNKPTILRCKEFLEKEGYTPRYFKEKGKKANHKDSYMIRLNKQDEINDLLRKRPKKITISYIAGIIDGDGSFYYAKQDMKRRFTLHCTKERKRVIFRKIKKFLQKEYSLCIREYEKIDYRLSICKPKETNKLVKIVNPYLINKKQNEE